MNSVRIIGGAWRRRVVCFPDAESLRPTPDRVRETLFNWLGQDLSGLSCLDLFAGSGALGFEAASRGAARVVMVERSAGVAAALRSNARLLGAAERVEIVQADAVKFASSRAAGAPRFDVLFLDPPYNQGWLGRLGARAHARQRPGEPCRSPEAGQLDSDAEISRPAPSGQQLPAFQAVFKLTDLGGNPVVGLLGPGFQGLLQLVQAG